MHIFRWEISYDVMGKVILNREYLSCSAHSNNIPFPLVILTELINLKSSISSRRSNEKGQKVYLNDLRVLINALSIYEISIVSLTDLSVLKIGI